MTWRSRFMTTLSGFGPRHNRKALFFFSTITRLLTQSVGMSTSATTFCSVSLFRHAFNYGIRDFSRWLDWITPSAVSMTSAEKNYAQITKEMLSIVFAVRKFHQYVYGQESVLVESDHKPIESIMRKPLGKAPPRLLRLMLKLQ